MKMYTSANRLSTSRPMAGMSCLIDSLVWIDQFLSASGSFQVLGNASKIGSRGVPLIDSGSTSSSARFLKLLRAVLWTTGASRPSTASLLG